MTDLSGTVRVAANGFASELDELARITPEDIARAEASARQYGDALFNAMLDATLLDEPNDLIERVPEKRGRG